MQISTVLLIARLEFILTDTRKNVQVVTSLQTSCNITSLFRQVVNKMCLHCLIVPSLL